MNKVDKGFELVYWKLSYRRKSGDYSHVFSLY